MQVDEGHGQRKIVVKFPADYHDRDISIIQFPGRFKDQRVNPEEVVVFCKMGWEVAMKTVIQGQ